MLSAQTANAQNYSSLTALQSAIQQISAQISSLGSIIGLGQASTSAAANIDPKGYFDVANCSVFAGWACDANDYGKALTINFYADGLPGQGGIFVGAVSANATREAAVGSLCGNNTNHGFSYTVPDSLKDGKQHTIYAYAINTPTGNNPLLSTNGKQIQCSPYYCTAENQTISASKPCCSGLVLSNSTSAAQCIKPNICGNGICETNETISSCPKDCCNSPMSSRLQAQIAAVNAQLAQNSSLALQQQIAALQSQLNILQSCGNVSNANLTVSLDPNSPKSRNIIADSKRNIVGAALLTFDANAGNTDVLVSAVNANFTVAGASTVSNAYVAPKTAYLYDDSGVLIGTASPDDKGRAVFTNLNYTIGKNTAKTFSIRFDDTLAAPNGSTGIANTDGQEYVATVPTGGISFQSNGINGTNSGSATSNAALAYAQGPIFTLSSINASPNQPSTISATFNIQVQAVTNDIYIPEKAAFEVDYEKNGTVYNTAGSMSNTSYYVSNVSYIQPAGTSASSNGYYYKISQGTSVTFIVNAKYVTTDPASGTYDLRIHGIEWNHTGNTSQDVYSGYMAGDPMWASQSIYLQGAGSSPVCGNNICETGETNSNCPKDCPVQSISCNQLCKNKNYASGYCDSQIVFPGTSALLCNGTNLFSVGWTQDCHGSTNDSASKDCCCSSDNTCAKAGETFSDPSRQCCSGLAKTISPWQTDCLGYTQSSAATDCIGSGTLYTCTASQTCPTLIPVAMPICADGSTPVAYNDSNGCFAGYNCKTPAPSCGNGACETWENAVNCPQDCPGNNNVVEISPYDSDVKSCTAASGKVYATTGVSDYARWFIWNGCSNQKSYNVPAGKSLILSAYGDTSMCPGPNFTLYEYRGSDWTKVAQVNVSGSTPVPGSSWIANLNNYLYAPSASKIKIVAGNCFYLKIFAGDTASLNNVSTKPLPLLNTLPVCGNGKCESGENSSNCPKDCGITSCTIKNNGCDYVSGWATYDCAKEGGSFVIDHCDSGCMPVGKCVQTTCTTGSGTGCPTNQVCANGTCVSACTGGTCAKEIDSGTLDMVVAKQLDGVSQPFTAHAAAVIPNTNSAWTHIKNGGGTNIPWVWNTADGDNTTALKDKNETYVFERQFDSFGSDVSPVSATLVMAADNNYSVSLNGSAVANCSGTDGFKQTRTCQLTNLQPGNALDITVTNTKDGYTANPAGLTYKLILSGKQTNPACNSSLTGDACTKAGGQTICGAYSTQCVAPTNGWTACGGGGTIACYCQCPTPVVGGNCTYKTFPGTCTIVTNNGSAGFNYRFTPSGTPDISGTFLQSVGQISPYNGTASSWPSSAGTTSCSLSVITGGTCTPINVGFPAITSVSIPVTTSTSGKVSDALKSSISSMAASLGQIIGQLGALLGK